MSLIKRILHLPIDLLWRAVAWLLSNNKKVVTWLVVRSMDAPYKHIYSPDGSDVYMLRYWLLNPYDNQTRRKKISLLPWSIRLHFIRMKDLDRHCHDHPWNARTIILDGWYIEERDGKLVKRSAGYTGRLRFGEFHRIDEVSPDGVWTLFITGPQKGTWGFLVDGVKVPYQTYLGE